MRPANYGSWTRIRRAPLLFTTLSDGATHSGALALHRIRISFRSVSALHRIDRADVKILY